MNIIPRPLQANNSGFGRMLPVLAVMLTGTASVMVIGLKPMLLTAYVGNLSFSNPQAGYVIASEMFGAMFGTLAVATRIHVWNRRRIAFVGLGIVLAGNLASITVSSYPIFMPLRFLTGFGAGIASGVMAGSMAAMSNPDRLWGIYTIVTLGLAAAAFAVVPDLLNSFGIGGIYLLLAAMTLPALALLPHFPSFPPTLEMADHAAPVEWKNLPLLAAGTVFLGTIAFYLAAGGVWPYMGQIGISTGLTVRETAHTLALSQIWGAAGALVPFLLGTRYGRTLPLGASLLVSAVCLVVLLVATGNVIAYSTSVYAYMFAWLIFFPYLMGVTAQLDRWGRLSSLIYTIQNIGFAVGPVITAWLVGTEGFPAIYQMGIACYVATIIFILPIAMGQDRQRIRER